MVDSLNARDLLDFLGHGVLVVDKSAKIIYANKSAKELFSSFANFECYSSYLHEIIPSLAKEKYPLSWEKARLFELRGQDIVAFASKFADKKGDELSILVIQKLEELEPLYRELIMIKQELEQIFNSSYDEIFTTGADGTALRVSAEACRRLYGVEPEELIGRNVKELEAEGYFRPSVYDIVMRDKKRITVMQTNKMGQKTIVTANPILDSEGNVLRIICNSRDVTELINLREQLQETEIKMQQYYEELMKFKQGTRGIERIIVESPKMKKILEITQKVARFDSTVLLLGESGVGKDMIAKFIHEQSRRCDGPFVKINCGAIPDTLLESELFGYAGGAFTGARKEGKKGLIEEAEGGTLYLDEIAEMPYYLQVKLLQVIEERIFVSVGSSKPKKVDLRIIAATNRDLKTMIQKGKFREDLYYRLNVISLRIPPLRERPEDIRKLCQFFVDRFNKNFGMQKSIQPETMEVFLKYRWPGNVRELENFIERFLVMGEEDVLSPKHLPAYMLEESTGQRDSNQDNSFDYEGKGQAENGILTLQEAVEEAEKQALSQALQQFRTVAEAARALGVSHSTVLRRLKKYGISYTQPNFQT